MTGVTITNAGAGYASTPTVAFSGGGATTQATGTATILNGSVVGITVTDNYVDMLIGIAGPRVNPDSVGLHNNTFGSLP